MRVHRGQKSTGIFFYLADYLTFFFLTGCQIYKSKLPLSGNQGLQSTTVWRQASILWRITKSPWNLNKRWSKVEKWWGWSYPTSEVTGSGRECQAATAQEWPRRATPHPRSEATVRRSHTAYEARDSGREEPPHAQGQGRLPGRSTYIQGAMAALAQEGVEELFHVEGQEWRWWGDTLHPR